MRFTHSKAPKETIFRRWAEASLPPGYSAKTLDEPHRTTSVVVPASKLSRNVWNFGSTDVETLLSKLDASGQPVGSVLHIGQGMQTGLNRAFILDIDHETYLTLHKSGFAYERARNSDIAPYAIAHSGIYLMFPNATPEFAALPAKLQLQLKSYEMQLKQRAAYMRGNCEWWHYTWPLHQQYLDHARILCPYRASQNRFALDSVGDFLGITDTTVLFDAGQPEDLRYILGVLNSSVATFRFRFIGKLLGGGVYEYYENTVSKLPIPRRASGDADHDAIVDLVDRRIEAAAELRSTRLDDEQRLMQAVIDRIDAELNELVAGIFNLTNEDRKLIADTLSV